MAVSADRLKEFRVFQNLNDREVSLIAEYADEEVIPGGQRIFQEGSLATRLFLLEKGRVAIRMAADKVREPLEVEVLHPGEIFGWSAVTEPYTFTAEAWTLEECKVIVLSSDVLRDIFKKNSHIGYLVMREVASVISERLKAMRRRFVELLQRAKEEAKSK